MTHINWPSWPHIPPHSPYITSSITPVQRRSSRATEFRPVKAGTKTAHVVFILDDSYSMQSIREQTIAAYNEFLRGQQNNEIPTYVSLYKFDGNSITRVLDHVKAQSAEPLNMNTYNPNGSTNLLDAFGEVMFAVNNRLAAHDRTSRRDSVTIVALTDGQENSSTEYANSDIKGMVEKAEGREWSFIFLGANINAFDVGGALGFKQHNTMQFDTNNIVDAIGATSRMASDMTTLKAAGMSNMAAYANAAYTDEERTKAGG